MEGGELIELSRIQLDSQVETSVKATFVNEKTIQRHKKETCEDHFTSLLSCLTRPPGHTTLRINTLHPSTEAAYNHVVRVISQDYEKKGWDPPEVELHPLIPDVLVISNRGPINELQICEKQVVVDRLCGMAVLRGADVFCQGVMAAHTGMKAGDQVSVFMDVEGKCLKGLTKPYHGERFFVGNGMAHVSREELFSQGGAISGVGVEMTDPLYQAPCLSSTLQDRVFAQNLPSIVCGHVLDPQPGEFILDMCAAPGGKTTHIACLMGNKGRVVALDKVAGKVRKIEENCSRFGITCVDAYTFDGSKSMSLDAGRNGEPPYPPETFDRVLVDAPCSALGQRPSLKNNMSIHELNSFPKYQRKILSTAVDLVRPGGVLVYSTCSLPLAENEAQVAWLLHTYPHYTLDDQTPYVGQPGFAGTALSDAQLSKLQRFDPAYSCVHPEEKSYNTDTIGFFIAKFRRK